jgi:hypothetical protein
VVEPTATGIKVLREVLEGQVAAALIPVLIVVVYVVTVAAELADKVFQVVPEYVSTMTEKIHIMVVVAAEQVALVWPVKIQINVRLLMVVQVRPATY